MFTEASFIRYPNWKQPKHSSTEEEISVFWCIHTVKYYTTRKKNQFLKHKTTYIYFKNHVEPNKPAQKCMYYDSL